MKITAKTKGKILKSLAALVGITMLIHIAHALTLDRIIQYREVSFYSANLPVQLSGYRIAFVSDTHDISPARLQGVVDRLGEMEIDLLLLGGDYNRNHAVARQTMQILSLAQTADGIFGVPGNHDNPAVAYAAMEAYAITPLFNRGLHIHEGLFLAGVEDLWNGSPDIALATAQAQPGDFVLLLAHNPDVTMRQDTTGVDLILSGHTHGGQITFFGLWAPALTHTGLASDYGQRFMSGWAHSRDGVPVYVSKGTGDYLPRVFARPQVILITLLSEVNPDV